MNTSIVSDVAEIRRLSQAITTLDCNLCATDQLGKCYWHDPHPLTRRDRTLELRYAAQMVRIVPITPKDET